MSVSRPGDLPEMRMEMLEWFTDPRAQEAWSEPWRRAAGSGLSRVGGASPRDLQKHFHGRLGVADLYWASAQMAELSEAAGESMPPFDLQPEDVPSPNGILFFEKPVTAVSFSSDAGTVRYEIDCLVWGTTRNPDGRHEGIVVYALRGEAPRSLPANVLIVEYGEEMPESWNGAAGYYRLMRTCWLLMKQPLADLGNAEPDRASKKRIRRAGSEPASVRVINLRRPKSTSGEGVGESNYHHQWIVRGHWRNHWHPKREVHRPVWIAPHVKGPEGAPMIGGEKVYALRSDPAEDPPA